MIQRTSNVQSFRLRPLNLMFSSQEGEDGATDQDRLLQTFWPLFDKLSNPFTIDIKRRWESMLFNKTTLQCPFDVVNLNITEDSAQEIMQTIGSQEDNPPVEGFNWEVAEEYNDCVRLVDGDKYAKSYTLEFLNDPLYAGWLYESIYMHADAVRIFAEPIPENKWDSTIRGHSTAAKTFSSAFGIDMTENIIVMKEFVVNKNYQRLYFIKIVPIIFSDTREELVKRAKEFEIKTKSTPGIHTNNYVQSSLLNGKMAQKILACTSVFNCILPFYTSELYEEGGILLGQNVFTGNPVKWNIRERMNRNTVLAATSGSGKSVTSMLIIHAFEKMYPESFIFIVDPENEYLQLGKHMGFEYVDYSFGKSMGLDLFKMLSDSFLATETLCNALGVPEVDRIIPNDAAGQMMGMSIEERSFFKFYDLIEKTGDESTLKYFKILVNPPYRDFFSGEPPKSKKIVLSLKNLGAAGGTVHRLITQISLAYAMGRAMSMKKIYPKLFMLDEVWMLLQHGSLGDYIDHLSRRGRKYNINLMMATQNIEDMTNNESARNVLVNSDTVIFLRNSGTTLNNLSAHFPQLSKSAISYIIQQQKGYALIKYGNEMVPTHIMPDKEQLDMFKAL